MPSTTHTDRCPQWCARDHHSDTVFYHASAATSVTVSQSGRAAPDRLDVQTAQYLPDDPGEPAGSPAVEISVHAGGRYRLIGLTPEEARELAGMLARAADMLTVARLPKSA